MNEATSTNGKTPRTICKKGNVVYISEDHSQEVPKGYRVDFYGGCIEVGNNSIEDCKTYIFERAMRVVRELLEKDFELIIHEYNGVKTVGWKIPILTKIKES